MVNRRPGVADFLDIEAVEERDEEDEEEDEEGGMFLQLVSTRAH